MLIPQTLLAIAEHFPTYLSCLLISALLIITINKKFTGNFLGGLFGLQLSFSFNLAIILFGYAIGSLSLGRVMHFLGYEFLVIAMIYQLYRQFIGDQDRIFQLLNNLPLKAIAYLIIAFNILMTSIYATYVTGDGSSRIEFMTFKWFSLLRPFMSVLLPLGFFLAIYLLDQGKRLLPLGLLAASVASNVASGSKASFVIGILSGLWLFEDLRGSRLRLSRITKIGLSAAVAAASVQALARLQVTLGELGERFVKFGESTIIVYFSQTPMAASEGLTLFAKVHRGLAKLAGDASAADIDTLFGFALSKVEYGGHNFTGPNAQVPSYMLCNYSGISNLVGLASIAAYGFLIHLFYRKIIVSGRTRYGMVFFPFVISSLNIFPQDYYQGISDLTLIFALFLGTWALSSAEGAS